MSRSAAQRHRGTPRRGEGGGGGQRTDGRRLPGGVRRERAGAPRISSERLSRAPGPNPESPLPVSPKVSAAPPQAERTDGWMTRTDGRADGRRPAPHLGGGAPCPRGGQEDAAGERRQEESVRRHLLAARVAGRERPAGEEEEGKKKRRKMKEEEGAAGAAVRRRLSEGRPGEAPPQAQACRGRVRGSAPTPTDVAAPEAGPGA